MPSENNGLVALEEAIAHQHSVKKEDYDTSGTFRFVFPAFGFGALGGAENYPSLPEILPPYSRYSFFRQRDIWLLATPHYEGMWANVVATAVTKAASWAWSVESAVPLRRKRIHEVLRVSTAGIFIGWTSLIGAHLKSYLCPGIGVVEIERERKGPASRVRALHHLNPLRCIFTDDPALPVVYMDRKGKYHELKSHQVMLFPDMVDPTEGEFRLTQSSAERAYRTIALLAGIEKYLYEKVTGKRPQSLYFITGLTEKTLLNAVSSAEQDAARKGHVIFRGAAVTPIPGDMAINLVEIPLAELPDGFDAQQLRDDAYIKYADAVGLDPNDIDPRLAQKASMGSGIQSLVLEQKASGKGLAYWRRTWEDNLNLWATDAETSFRFNEQSTRDKQDNADLQGKQTETLGKQLEMQIIDVDQAKNLAVDLELLPREFIDEDRTGGDTLSSDDKPETETADDEEFIAKPPPATPTNGAQPKAPTQQAAPPAANGKAPEKTAKKEKESFACVMLPMPADIRARALAFGARISPLDLHEEGVEKDPHVTVLYGAAGGPEAVRTAASGPVGLTFGAVSLFTESDQYDVLKVDVDGEELRELNAALPRDPECEQRPIYHPHLTLAYLRPGTGRNYTGRGPFYGEQTVVDVAVYSDEQDEMTAVPLNGVAA